MGKQTHTETKTETQPQSQPLPQSKAPPPPQPVNLKSPLDPHALPPSIPVADFPADLSQISSKISIRPQKIRKLSSIPSAAVAVSPTTPATATKTRRRNPGQSAKDLPKVIKPLSTLGEVGRAIQHLRAADPLLANLINAHPQPTFDSHHVPFLALTKSILYQLLAYKAGTSIYTRFVTLCGGEDTVRTDTVLSLSAQQLKQIDRSLRPESQLPL